VYEYMKYNITQRVSAREAAGSMMAFSTFFNSSLLKKSVK